MCDPGLHLARLDGNRSRRFRRQLDERGQRPEETGRERQRLADGTAAQPQRRESTAGAVPSGGRRRADEDGRGSRCRRPTEGTGNRGGTPRQLHAEPGAGTGSRRPDLRRRHGTGPGRISDQQRGLPFRHGQEDQRGHQGGAGTHQGDGHRQLLRQQFQRLAEPQPATTGRVRVAASTSSTSSGAARCPTSGWRRPSILSR